MLRNILKTTLFVIPSLMSMGLAAKTRAVFTKTLTQSDYRLYQQFLHDFAFLKQFDFDGQNFDIC